MKKLIITVILLLTLTTTSFSQAQGVMYVSDRGPLLAQHLLL